MRVPALLLVAVVAGCGGDDDRPGDVVRDYLHARDGAACQYLTAAQAKLCRHPRLPETAADQVVIEGERIHENRATIRASYDWTGYRRRSISRSSAATGTGLSLAWHRTKGVERAVGDPAGLSGGGARGWEMIPGVGPALSRP